MADIIVNPAAATTPIDIVCGNGNTEVISFQFDRHSEGVDLAGLAWNVRVKNAAGFSDVYMEGQGITELEETEDTITVEWTLAGTATAAVGRTLYQLEGLQGKAVIKRFPVHTLNILSYLSTTLSTDAEEDHSQLRETIEYVGNELPGILEEEARRKAAEALRVEAETAREAAEAARQEAETARAAAEEMRVEAEEAREAAEEQRAQTFALSQQQRAEAFSEEQAQRKAAFEVLDLRVSKEGRTTTVYATNIDGTTTTANVLDGKDGEGSGDMSQATYDTDGDGVVDKADRANYATNAGHASTADGATHAASADNATNAANATNADHATTADTANVATTAVRFDTPQTLTPEQQAQARQNIASASTALYTATIPTTGWSDAAPYNVTIALPGILTTDTPLVDIVQTGDEVVDAPLREAWAAITRITTADGSITVYAAEEIPAVELPIQMRVVR